MPDLDALPLPDLFTHLTADGALGALLDLAQAEDLGDAGDVTTMSVVEPGRYVRAEVVAREAGVIAGLALLDAVVATFDTRGALEAGDTVPDGAVVEPGETVAVIAGPLPPILAIERTLLNLLGHLSGIATLTAAYVAAAGPDTAICATRKTLPGLRGLEKYAVRCGGGRMHRMGLYDAALYKDNHLARIRDDQLAAVLEPAIRTARDDAKLSFVEVEVDRLEQFDVILTLPAGLVDFVLLDNMEPAMIAKAIARRDAAGSAIRLEASGGIALDRIPEYAATGVERISVGAITHSARWLDVGLDV